MNTTSLWRGVHMWNYMIINIIFIFFFTTFQKSAGKAISLVDLNQFEMLIVQLLTESWKMFCKSSADHKIYEKWVKEGYVNRRY